MMEIKTIGSFHVARLATERMAAMSLGQPSSSDADGDDDGIRATVDMLTEFQPKRTSSNSNPNG